MVFSLIHCRTGPNDCPSNNSPKRRQVTHHAVRTRISGMMNRKIIDLPVKARHLSTPESDEGKSLLLLPERALAKICQVAGDWRLLRGEPLLIRLESRPLNPNRCRSDILEMESCSYKGLATRVNGAGMCNSGGRKWARICRMTFTRVVRKSRHNRHWNFRESSCVYRGSSSNTL